MDREAFGAGQVVEQLADQVEVGAVAFFMGLADVFGVADQAPEHHPDPEQLRVHDPWREGADQEGLKLLRGAAGLADLFEQGAGQFAGELVVGVGDQCVDAAEMVVEQADGDAGLGGDTPYGNAGMAVPGQAAQGGGDQQVATLVGFGAAKFSGVGAHGNPWVRCQVDELS